MSLSDWIENSLRQREGAAPGRLCWRIVLFSDVDRDALRAALIARGRKVLGGGTAISVILVGEIARTSAGKFNRAVVSSRGSER